MLIAILNIYNPLNNIKFIEEKKSEKIVCLVLDFLKGKNHTKRKRKRKGKLLYSPHFKNKLLS